MLGITGISTIPAIGDCEDQFISPTLCGLSGDARYIWRTEWPACDTISCYETDANWGNQHALICQKRRDEKRIDRLQNVVSCDSTLNWLAVYGRLPRKDLWTVSIVSLPYLEEQLNIISTKSNNYEFVGIGSFVLFKKTFIGILYKENFEIYSESLDNSSTEKRFSLLYSSASDTVFNKRPSFQLLKGPYTAENTAITCSDDRFYISRISSSGDTEVWYFQVLESTESDSIGGDVKDVRVVWGTFGSKLVTNGYEEATAGAFVIEWMTPFYSTRFAPCTLVDVETAASDKGDSLEGLWCIGRQNKQLIVGRVDSMHSKHSLEIWGSLATFSSRRLAINGYMLGAELTNEGGLLLAWNARSDLSDDPYINYFEPHFKLSYPISDASTKSCFYDASTLINGVQKYTVLELRKQEGQREWSFSKFLFSRSTLLKESMNQEILNNCNPIIQLKFQRSTIIRYGKLVGASAVNENQTYNGLYVEKDWVDFISFSAIGLTKMGASNTQTKPSNSSPRNEKESTVFTETSSPRSALSGIWKPLKRRKTSINTQQQLDTRSEGSPQLSVLKLQFQCTRKLLLDAFQRNCLTMLSAPQMFLKGLQEASLLPASCGVSREGITLNIDSSYDKLSKQEVYLRHCVLDMLLLNDCAEHLCATLLLRESSCLTDVYDDEGYVLSESFYHFMAEWACSRFDSFIPSFAVLGNQKKDTSVIYCINEIEDGLSRHSLEIRGLRSILGALLHRKCYSSHSWLLKRAIHTFCCCSTLMEWKRLVELLKSISLKGSDPKNKREMRSNQDDTEDMLTSNDRRFSVTPTLSGASSPLLHDTRAAHEDSAKRSLYDMLKEELSADNTKFLNTFQRVKRGRRALLCTTPSTISIFNLLLPTEEEQLQQSCLIEVYNKPLLVPLIIAKLPNELCMAVMGVLGISNEAYDTPDKRGLSYNTVLGVLFSIFYNEMKEPTEGWCDDAQREKAVSPPPTPTFTLGISFLIYILEFVSISCGETATRAMSIKFANAASLNGSYYTLSVCAILDLLMDKQLVESFGCKDVSTRLLEIDEEGGSSNTNECGGKQILMPSSWLKRCNHLNSVPYRWVVLSELSYRLAMTNPMLLGDPLFILVELIGLSCIAYTLRKQELTQLASLTGTSLEAAIKELDEMERGHKEASNGSMIEEFYSLQCFLGVAAVEQFVDNRMYTELQISRKNLMSTYSFPTGRYKTYHDETLNAMFNCWLAANIIGHLECNSVTLALDLLDCFSKFIDFPMNGRFIPKLVMPRLITWSLLADRFTVITSDLIKHREEGSAWVGDAVWSIITNYWKTGDMASLDNKTTKTQHTNITKYRKRLIKEALKALVSLHCLHLLTDRKSLQKLVDSIIEAKNIFTSAELQKVLSHLLSLTVSTSFIESDEFGETSTATLTRIQKELTQTQPS